MSEQAKPHSVLEAFDAVFGAKTLALTPKSWRIFTFGATGKKTEKGSVEIGCEWRRNLRVDQLFVGSTREKLDSIPIAVEIRRADDEFIKALQESEERNTSEGKLVVDVVGGLRYFEPMNSGDGVVDRKTGSINAFFSLGSAGFDSFRSKLLLSPELDFSIALAVRFPTNRDEWDGIGELELENGWLRRPPSALGAPILRRFHAGAIL